MMSQKTLNTESTNLGSPVGLPTRVFNSRLFVVTILVVAVLTTGAWVLRSWQVGRTAPVLLQRADDFEANADFKTSAEYVRRYLQLRPKDAAARVRLARTYLQTADTDVKRNRAVDLFYEAVGVADADQQFELRRQLAQLLLDVERFKAARIEAEKLIHCNPGDAEALKIRALAIYGQHQTGTLSNALAEKALVGQSCLDAIRANPADRHVVGILAFVYREKPELLPTEIEKSSNKTRIELADTLIDELVSADSQSPSPFITRFLYRVRYQLPGFEKDLEAALTRTDTDWETYLTAARYNVEMAAKAINANQAKERGEYIANAIRFYERILQDINPLSEIAFTELGDVHFLNSNTPAAIACWQIGLSKIGETSPRLNLRLAEAFVASSKMDDAQRHLDILNRVLVELENGQKSSLQPIISLLNAQVLIERGDYQSAIPMLQSVINSLDAQPASKAQGLQLLGKVHSKLKDWGSAAAAYERALSVGKIESESLWFAANAWANANQSNRAIERYQQLLTSSDSPEVWFALAQSQFQYQSERPATTRNWTSVRQTLDSLKQACQKHPMNQPWRITLLESDLLMVELVEDPQLNLEQATDRKIQAQKEKAFALLRKAETAYPKEVDLHVELAAAYQKLNFSNDAARALNQLNQLTGSGWQWKSATAMVARLKGNDELARQAIEEALKECPDDFQAGFYRMLASIDLQKQAYKSAVENLSRWRTLEPDSSEVRRTLATTLASMGGEENWRKALELLSSSGSSPADLRIKGQLLVKRGMTDDLIEATGIFDLLANRTLNSIPSDRLMLAQLLVGQGKPNAAQRQFLLLVSNPDVGAEHVAAYVEFLLRYKSQDDATVWIEKLKQLDPSSLHTAILVGRYSVAKGGDVDAAALRISAEKEFSNLATIELQTKHCLTVGEVFRQLELLDDATAWHRRLFELDPATFGPLAVSLARQNKLTEAIQICRDAEQNGSSASTAKVMASVLTVASPSETELKSAMPLLESSLLRHQQDADLFSAAGNVYINYGNSSKAIESYRRAISLRPNDVELLNNLAMLLAETEAAEGLELVNKAISLAGPQPNLLDTLGVLLLFNGLASDAVPVLEKAVQNGGNEPLFSFHLWAAYRDAKDQRMAQQMLQKIDLAKLESQVIGGTDRKLFNELKKTVHSLAQVTD